MIRSTVKFDGGVEYDLFDHYGMTQMQSDAYFDAPIKAFETTSYADEPGEHIYPKTVADAFDYTVTLIVLGSTLNTINSRIAAFNKDMYDGDSIRTYKRVEFFDAFNNVRYVGIPNPLSQAKEFYKDKNDKVQPAAVVEWKIRIDKPQSCTFNTQANSND